MTIKIKPEEAVRLPELYAEGKSIRQLAAQFGVSYSSMHYRLKNQGVQFRIKGGVKGGKAGPQ